MADKPPIGSCVMKLTNWVVRPIGYFIESTQSRLSKINIATDPNHKKPTTVPVIGH